MPSSKITVGQIKQTLTNGQQANKTEKPYEYIHNINFTFSEATPEHTTNKLSRKVINSLCSKFKIIIKVE